MRYRGALVAILAPGLLVPALLVTPGSATSAAGDPVIAAAGDIACDPATPAFNGGAGTRTQCRQKAVSDLLVNAGLSAVLPLGDEQYEDGQLTAFARSYDPSWGRVLSITRPTPGNHEYNTAGAAGYFGYFGSRAGSPGRGYYSYDVGRWHLIALNSQCSHVSCARGSAQERWLTADLAAHRNTCTLAYWHPPPVQLRQARQQPEVRRVLASAVRRSGGRRPQRARP